MVDTDGCDAREDALRRCVLPYLSIPYQLHIVYGTHLVTLIMRVHAFSFEARAQMVCAGMKVLLAIDGCDVKSSPAM